VLVRHSSGGLSTNHAVKSGCKCKNGRTSVKTACIRVKTACIRVKTACIRVKTASMRPLVNVE
jgi:hypothetical protein